MAAPVILIEATPSRPVDGSGETVLLAGGGANYPYHYGGEHWRAGIVKLPTFVTSLNFSGGDFGEGGVPQAVELQWAATSKADLSALADHYWIDAPITVRIGPENAEGTLPALALTGKVLSGLVDGGTVRIQLSDPAADLKKPLLTDRYAGTGGLDGPEDWDGKIKDRVWGRVWNKAGEPIDKANNIYAFSDPLRPIQAFDAVRDRGAAAASLPALAWQGSAEATFAALQAASAPAGGGVTCPSIACVKWWTQPSGELTADLRGEIGTGYVERTADIVARIVAAGPATPFAAGTIAAANTARPAPVGWVARDDSTTVAAMIEELLGNSSLLWLLNANGEIELREWAWGAPVAAATSYSVKRTAMFRPVSTRTLGYRRNERPMARGDIAGIVFAGDVLLADGRTGEALAAQINDVQALADASAAQIEAAAADGVLDRKEKSSILVPRDAALEASWSYLDGQAAVLAGNASVASARSTLADARTAWRTYRDSLSPAWNNSDLDTYVTRATLVGKLNDFDYALDLVVDALRKVRSINNVNLVRDAGFGRGLTGWGYTVNNGAINSGYPEFSSASGYQRMRLEASFSAGEDRFIGVFAGAPYFTVVPGQRYAVQALIEATGPIGGGSLYVSWLDADNAFIDPSANASVFTGEAAYPAALRGFVTAPVGAVRGIIGYRANVSGAGGATISLAAPMVTTATADQTDFPAFALGSETGADGSNGINTATINIFQRGSSAPTLPSSATIYTFGAKSLDGLNNGWTTSIPTGSDPLWQSAATAASQSPTDTIAASEWASPVQIAANGESAANSASVLLYNRTSTSTAPDVPSATVTYDFASGTATGMNNGWTQSLPATGGAYRWQINAAAVSVGSTDTIASGEWSAPRILAQDGTDGMSPIQLTLSTYSVTVEATYAGVTKPGQLPRTATVQLMSGTTNVLSSAAITVTPSSSAITTSYSDGTIMVSAADAAGYFDVSASIDGTVVGTARIEVKRPTDAPPPASQTSAAEDCFDALTGSTAYSGPIGRTVLLKANGSGALSASGGGEYIADPPGSGIRTIILSAAIAYRVPGGSWSYSSEAAGSQATSRPTSDPVPGSVTLARSISGLTAGVVYEVGLAVRQSGGTTGATGYFDGSIVVQQ